MNKTGYSNLYLAATIVCWLFPSVHFISSISLIHEKYLFIISILAYFMSTYIMLMLKRLLLEIFEYRKVNNLVNVFILVQGIFIAVSVWQSIFPDDYAMAKAVVQFLSVPVMGCIQLLIGNRLIRLKSEIKTIRILWILTWSSAVLAGISGSLIFAVVALVFCCNCPLDYLPFVYVFFWLNLLSTMFLGAVFFRISKLDDK